MYRVASVACASTVTASAPSARFTLALGCVHPLSRFTTTRTALKRRWFKGLFRWRQRTHPIAEPGAGGRFTLFHQDDVPEDLRLSPPADPVARTTAGAIDAALALGGGAVAGWLAHALTGSSDVASASAAGAATALWVLRDGLGDGGNRSVGKAIMRVELAYWDGALASPAHALTRNAIVLAWPLAGLHPMLEMLWTTSVVFDGASLFLTADARKLGDYALGTRVVAERPGRQGRAQDRADALEMARLRADIDALSPGLLQTPDAARVLGVAPASHEEVQRALVARAAAETHELAARIKAAAAEARREEKSATTSGSRDSS